MSEHTSAEPTQDDSLWRVLNTELTKRVPSPARVFEIGCGSGSVARNMAAQGYDVTATDPYEPGLVTARSVPSRAQFHRASVYDRPADTFGTFDAVVSLEVIEHLYAPRELPRAMFDLLKPGGYGFISTPYHGYLKNLALAVTGRFDSHFTTLWDGGHVKFFNAPQLTQVCVEAGLEVLEVRRIGRIPALARTMLAVVRRS